MPSPPGVLLAAFLFVLFVLCSCLSQPGETVRGQMLESLGCWLKLSGGTDLPAGLPSSPLITAALEGLGVDGTFHAAVDAVSAVTALCGGNCDVEGTGCC